MLAGLLVLVNQVAPSGGNPIVSVPAPAPAPNVSVTVQAPPPDPALVQQTGLDLATSVTQAAGDGLNALSRAAFDAGGLWTCDPLRGALDLPQVQAVETATVAIALGSLAVLVGWTGVRVMHEEATWGEALPRLAGLDRRDAGGRLSAHRLRQGISMNTNAWQASGSGGQFGDELSGLVLREAAPVWLAQT